MSLRNMRKLREAKISKVESEDSDVEYEPPCVKQSCKSIFDGLIVSSSSDEEADSNATELSEKEMSRKCGNASNKKKKWANNKSSKSDHGIATASKKLEKKKKKKRKRVKSFTNTNGLDEVEQSLLEVNALLGEPAKPDIEVVEEHSEKARLFSINWKHINRANELTRLYGQGSEHPSRKTGRQPHFNRIHKSKIIETDMKFERLGLSMSVVHQDSKKICFAFDHSKKYQEIHNKFVMELHTRSLDWNSLKDTSLKHMHVEGLIQASDLLFQLDDDRQACDIIEKAIAYMHYAALPSFNLLDLRTRLEYKYRENRAFHIMLLKHIHLLSNRACHHAAMELAKVLLNLDESDPMGVLFVIDVIAIRAREYKWLLDTIAFLEHEEILTHMFNIKFSRALAQFLTSRPNSAERETSDTYIQHALLTYPSFIRRILHYTHNADQSILEFNLYSDFASDTTPICLKDMIGLYASLTAQYWREGPVMAWLLRNATSLGQTYDEDHLLRQTAQTYGDERTALFQRLPDNMHRHLIVIKVMADFLSETAIPYVTRFRSYDPVPPSDTVSRSDDTNAYNPVVELANSGSLFREFVRSLLPDYVVPYDSTDDYY